MPYEVCGHAPTAYKDGVQLALDATYLGTSASPRGYNSALALAQTGVPYVQTRKGVSVLRRASTASLTITSQFAPGAVELTTPVTSPDEIAIDAPPDTPVWIGTTDTGKWLFPSSLLAYTLEESLGSFTVVNKPDWAQAGNFTYMVNGYTSAWKLYGDEPSTFGITRPTVGTMAGAAGAAGLHNGTYELRVTYYNSASGHESSASDTASATVTVTNQSIDWTNIPVSADSQVTHRYLYARNTDTQTQFYRVGTVADNTTTTATTSLADSNALTPAPGTAERNPPPSGVTFITYYRGRLFVAGQDRLYWSAIDAPEAFDSLAYATVGFDGKPITGIYADQDAIIITKERATYILRGEVADSYSIDLQDGEVGGTAHDTFVSAGGYTYWWSHVGLVRWRGGLSALDRIGLATFGDPNDRVNMAYDDNASAVAHPERTTIYLTLPGPGQSRNTFILPFNYQLGVLEAELWDPMDAASLGTYRGEPCLGGYYSQVAQLWSGNTDGIFGTKSYTGTFTAASESVTTITDGSATFQTYSAGAELGLEELKVSIYASDGTCLTTSQPRPRITSNTATSFTLHQTVTGLTTGATYTYVIGGPDFQWDTPWLSASDIFRKKRYEFLYLHTRGSGVSPTASVELFFDGQLDTADRKFRRITDALAESGWDADVWDTDVWDADDYELPRRRIGQVGKMIRVRLRNGQANSPLALLALGIQSAHETRKR